MKPSETHTKKEEKEKLMVCKSESPGLPRWQAGGFVYDDYKEVTVYQAETAAAQ